MKLLKFDNMAFSMYSFYCAGIYCTKLANSILPGYVRYTIVWK